MILGAPFALLFGEFAPAPSPTPTPIAPVKVDQVQRGVDRLALQFKSKLA